MFFETVRTDNGCDRSLFKSAGNIRGCVLKFTVKSVVCIVRLRQRKKDIARLHFARVDREIRDFSRGQGGINVGNPCLRICDKSFQFQVFGFVFQIAGAGFVVLGSLFTSAVLSEGGRLFVSVLSSLFAVAGNAVLSLFVLDLSSSGGPLTPGSTPVTSGTS